ncbi:hypothetical protein MMC25_007344 [Agyrium rufum]|nr:hypothetical protein [Agyrium rufum]
MSFGNRISSFLKGSQETPPLPPLSTLAFFSVSVVLTLIYILPFYAFAPTRPSPTLARDTDVVIRARIRCVTVACFVSSLVTVQILRQYASVPTDQILPSLGWWPISILDISRSLLLTATLFLGPLFEKGVVERQGANWIRLRGLRDCLGSWIGWRNYVAGPLTEELLFRTLLVPLSLLTLLSTGQSILLTPLVFGVAHVHHAYEFHLMNPTLPWSLIAFRSLFQFTYTTLFGWYANFVLVRTGSGWACVVVHAFCNWMGLPRFWGKVERAVEREAGNHRGKEDDGHIRRSEIFTTLNAGNAGEASIGWTIAYYVLLIMGTFGFWKGLWPLTESDNALAKI